MAAGKRKAHSKEDQDDTTPPKKSRRVDATQAIQMKMVPFSPKKSALALESRHRHSNLDVPSDPVVDMSSVTPGPVPYQAQDDPLDRDSCSKAETSDCFPSDSYGNHLQPTSQGDYAFAAQLDKISCQVGTGCGATSSSLASVEGLNPMTKTVPTELAEPRMDNVEALVDPLLRPDNRDTTSGSTASTSSGSSPTSGVGATKAINAELRRDEALAFDQVDSAQQEAYSVDCLLGRWGKDLFFLRWLDGSYGWEPRENILDEELVRQFEESYKGFDDEVEVLRTRTRNGKLEYRLHWNGRPKSEDWWVAEKELSPDLIEKHRPEKKSKVRGRRRRQ